MSQAPTKRLRTWWAVAALMAPVAAVAVEPYSCRNGLFPSQLKDIRAARVVAPGKTRVHFRDDGKGCPEAGACIGKAYLVNGDRLLVSTSADGWTCGWYFGKRSEFVGWLPSSQIAVGPASPAPRIADWTGRWVDNAGIGTITIEPSGEALVVAGSTTWRGGPEGENVHLGEFGGHAQPVGDTLRISDGEGDLACSVALRRVAEALVVTDNGQCGGMNVRFDGIYRRHR